jgi:hypothetical protein
MTNTECFKLIGILFTSYPSARLETAHAESYVSGIVDLPLDAATKAVDRLRRTSKFLPSVSEIREAAADVVLGPRRSGEAAYAVVMEAIRRFGRDEVPKFSDPHITRALGVWGGWVGVCNSPDDDPGGRARFVELYEQLVRNERLDVVAGAELPAPRGSEFILPERAGKRKKP